MIEGFEKLAEKRQVSLALPFIQELLDVWEDEIHRTSGLEELSKFFRFLESKSKDEVLAKISRRWNRGDLQLDQRGVLDFLVPMERYLNSTPSEKNIVGKVLFEDSNTEKQPSLPHVLILDHLRSSFNVGSIIRTADALGFSKAYFVGYTPMSDTEAVKKTSMGAEIESYHVDNSVEVIENLKKKGFKILALETTENAVSLDNVKLKSKEKFALWLGNERFGISLKELEMADEVISIPMRGKKNSLNVATAFGIAGFALSSKH